MQKRCHTCEFYSLSLGSVPCRHCDTSHSNWCPIVPTTPKKEIPMDNELQVLIAAIRTMQSEEYSLDWLERYNNLVDCLIIESGKQIGRRANDK
jgi:hypothetical protein